ncbi:hypothetical protein BC941DRAFT_27138 [Chlamydoabsidia padenii]|nr:hypothetical protein BC941DRAFT_27138 [Chlamydoabsidia padenii]
MDDPSYLMKQICKFDTLYRLTLFNLFYYCSSMGDKTSRGKHPAQLQCIGNEGAYTQRWLDRLKSTIYFCKGAKKIIKFNYSPQQKMDQHHPYYRGYLTTMDYWIYDAAKKEDSNLDNSTTNMDDEQQRRVQEMTPPVEGVEPWIQRLDRLNDLYFYADAMLLHKRYIENDTRQRSASFETCYQAAEQAISLATHLSTKELQVLSTSPITLYSIVMALQIMGACCLSLKTNQQQQQQQQQLISSAELLYEMGYHALHRLPIFQNPQSMMHDTLCHLWNLYNDYCATRKNGDILLLKPIINSSWSNEFDHPFNAFLVDTATAFIHQTTEVASTKGEQQMVGNVITSTLDANLSCQPTTTSHHPIVTKQPITLVDSLTTNRIDPEVIPVAVYETSFDPNDLTSTFGLSRSLDSQQWTIPTPNSFSSPTFSSMYSSPAQDMF